MRTITDKRELKDYEVFKKQLKLIGGHRTNEEYFNCYTNYMKNYTYVYNADTDELERVDIE